ncbi:MAG: hypothetical protein A2Y38_12285 [Spirochaetes bacterium GWB1_59_5]|nr:MAG: hypothetical protein A2Y38_12285 [Spirochaetes bacterium GWB1_59_5]
MSRKGQTSPRTVTLGLRQRAWWVMRRRISVTLPELLSTLADGTERDAASNLGRYLRALEKAGIIRREAARQPGAATTSNGHIRYQLIINAGRKAPVWRIKSEVVYDPNSGIVYDMEAPLPNPLPQAGEGANEKGINHEE